MVSEKGSSPAWYQHGVGERIICLESEALSKLLQRLYGYHLVMLGDPGLTALVGSSLISHRILINPRATGEEVQVSSLKGALESIPLRSDSVDVVVLPHTLEESANPHEVLRESNRILIPEGHIIITGFNPISMLGVWHGFQKLVGGMPRKGKMLSPSRVRDWLSLLNFQIVGGSLFYYRPPLNRQGLYEKLAFMEKWGEHCWPFFAGAYTLLAVKRVIPVTPIRVKWSKEKRLWQPASAGIPKPIITK